MPYKSKLKQNYFTKIKKKKQNKKKNNRSYLI